MSARHTDAAASHTHSAPRPWLRRLLEAAVVLTLILALGVLAHRRSARLVDEQVALLCGSSRARSDRAMVALVGMGGRGVKPLMRALHDSKPGPTQDRIARTLGCIGDRRASDALFAAAQQGSLGATWSLHKMGDPRGAEALFEMAQRGSIGAGLELKHFGDPRGDEALALAYCLHGEALLAQVERVAPFAPDITTAMGLVRRRGSAQALYSAGGLVREAASSFARAARASGDLRAVRGMCRAWDLAPDACGSFPAESPVADAAAAKFLADREERQRRRQAICEALSPELGQTTELRSLVAFGPRGAERLQAALIIWVGGQPAGVVWGSRDLDVSVGTYADVFIGVCKLTADGSAVTAVPVVPFTVWVGRVISGVWLAGEDLDGDGQRELLVTAQDDPHYLLAVYRWDGTQLQELLRARSELPIVVADSDRDGDQEIVTTRRAGYRLDPTQALPMWPWVFALKNGRYVRADEDYPEVYRKVLPQFQREAARNRDPKVLDCLGRIYRILGRKQEALEAFQAALKGYRWVGPMVGGEAGSRLRRDIAQLQSELRRDSHPPGVEGQH